MTLSYWIRVGHQQATAIEFQPSPDITIDKFKRLIKDEYADAPPRGQIIISFEGKVLVPQQTLVQISDPQAQLLPAFPSNSAENPFIVEFLNPNEIPLNTSLVDFNLDTFLTAIAVKFPVRAKEEVATHFDAFGVPLRDIPFILKTAELEAAWEVIMTRADDKKSNRAALYYFHGSSGIGKTYLFRMLMSYKWAPMDLQSDVNNTQFLILNFNNGAIPVEDNRIVFFKQNPKLFIFLRIFWSRYVSTANSNDDLSTQWGKFLDCLFDNSNPLSTFLSNQMVEPLSNFFKSLIAEERMKTVLLVDELEKSEPPGAKQNIRELICRLIGNTFTFVFFSALDVELLRSIESTQESSTVLSRTSSTRVTPSDRLAELFLYLQKKLSEFLISIFPPNSGTVNRQQVTKLVSLSFNNSPSVAVVIRRRLCNSYALPNEEKLILTSINSLKMSYRSST
jgi:hypothetical protein